MTKLLLIEINAKALEKVSRDDYCVMAEYDASAPEIGSKYRLIADIKKIASTDYRHQMDAVDKLEKEIELLKDGEIRQGS